MIKKARKIRNGLMIAGFFTMLSAYFFEPLFYVGFILTLSCLIPHFLYNKCPHCGKQLGRNEGIFCQYCGKKIDE